MSLEIDILYQDEDLLIVNKPTRMLSIPGSRPDKGISVGQALEVQGFKGTSIVHRLDQDTSGLMIIPRHKDAHRYIGKQFEHRQVKKTYIANVWGKLGEAVGNIGTVNAPLCRDVENPPRQMVDAENGKEAITDWEVISYGEQSTRVLLKPETGRSHQLRVHMLEIGHPILGDSLYATPQAHAASPRLQLHAQYIAFTHPRHRELVEFTCDPEF